MTDTEIILNVIQTSIPDDHPYLHDYIIGDKKGEVFAILRALKLFEGILTPPYTIGHVRRTVKKFFKGKKEQHSRGEIEISSIY